MKLSKEQVNDLRAPGLSSDGAPDSLTSDHAPDTIGMESS